MNVRAGKWNRLVTAFVTTLTVVALAVTPVLGMEPSPPPQPATGPGGSDYAHGGVTVERAGVVPTGTWVFSPEDMSGEERTRAPVVLFLHGFGATDPQTYRGWISHLARRGNIVIYPDYQPAGFLVFDQAAFVANMLDGIERGLAETGVTPDTIHIAGHSLGAVLGAAYLASGPEAGLPAVASLTLVAPGGCSTCGANAGFGVPLPDDLPVPEGLLVNIVTGSDDTIVGSGDALAILDRLQGVPDDRKRLVEVQSDRHGEPELAADHLFPQSDGFGSEVDALDWYGVWRPLDSLIACAESRAWCGVALGTDAEALFMGEWSDGTPVTLPEVIDGGRRS